MKDTLRDSRAETIYSLMSFVMKLCVQAVWTQGFTIELNIKLIMNETTLHMHMT